MGQDFKHSIVSINNEKGDIFGTGFVIDKQTVVTCAHVVEAAGTKKGETLSVKLFDKDDMIAAKVTTINNDNDVAILALSENVPEDVQPAILGHWDHAKFTEFRSFGYRRLGEFQGLPAEGRILGKAQIIDPTKPHPTKPTLTLSSQHIDSGMSGSPVYAPSTDRVVGMITAIWKSSSGKDAATAFAISADAIIAAYPRISLNSMEPVTSKESVQKQIDAHTRRPRILQKKQAIIHGISVPPEVTIEIEDIEPVTSKESVQKQIDAYTRRLGKLQEQRAILGISTPPEVRIEIENIEATIAELQADLDKLTQPLVVGKESPPPKSPPQLSWRRNFPMIRPSLASSALSDLLARYDPFPATRAENELSFLFGETSVFWTEHPDYIRLVSDSKSKIIVSASGMGRTAFANALSQIGDVNGDPLDTLPVLISNGQGDWQNIKSAIAETLLIFSSVNLWHVKALPVAKQAQLIGFLVGNLGETRVKARLHQAYPNRVSESSNLNHGEWIETVKDCLDWFNFKRMILAIDFSLSDEEHLKTITRLINSDDRKIIANLFVPEQISLQQNNWPRKTLEWDHDQLKSMAEWRFESISRFANTRLELPMLFEEGLYEAFIQSANSPRQLAELWQALLVAHLKNSPQNVQFTALDLKEAKENLK